MKDSVSSASQSAAVQSSSSTKTNAVTRETSQKDIASSKAVSSSANIQSSISAASISSQSVVKSSKVVSSSVSAKSVKTYKTTTLAAQPAAVSAKAPVANATSTDTTPSNTSKVHATAPVITAQPTHNTTTPVTVNDHEFQNAVNSAKKFGVKVIKDSTREGTVESDQVKEVQKRVQKDYQNQIAAIHNIEMEQSKYNAEPAVQIKAHDAAVAQNQKIDAANKLAQANYQKQLNDYNQDYQAYEDKLKKLQSSVNVINGVNHADLKENLDLGEKPTAKMHVDYINSHLKNVTTQSSGDVLLCRSIRIKELSIICK